MARKVHKIFFSLFIISVILRGIQGHPPRRLIEERSAEDDQRSGEDETSPETSQSNSNEPQLPGHRVRDSLDVDYEPRMKVSVHDVRQNVESDGKIVFPSDLHAEGIFRYNITIVPKNFTPSFTAICENATYCINPPDYPGDFIRNAIRSRNDLQYLATIDTVPEIGQRIDADDGDSLCRYEDKVIFPKSGKNKDNEWHYIINEENFPQGVRIEQCVTENTACSIIEGFSDGWKTQCKQKYVYRQLAAVSPDGSIEKDLFRFAASCCCHVKFMGSPAARIGALVGGNKTNSQSPVPRKNVSRAGEARKK